MPDDTRRDSGFGTLDSEQLAPGSGPQPSGPGSLELGEGRRPEWDRTPNPESRIPNLDAAIDIVAREMTALDAPGDLRARVLAEIDAAAPRHAWWRTPVWPTAAAAALLAALVWMWPQPAPKPALQQAAKTPPPVAQPVTEQPVRAGVPAGTTASQHIVSNATPRRPVAGRTVSADVMTATAAESTETDAESWVVVELLPDPNPIAIDPLSVSPVEITTLTIPELRVDPVDPGRDPGKR